MTCQINNETHFEEKQDYTVLCNVCNCYVKLFKYRPCEQRLNTLIAAGEDVYESIREAERIAAAQTGRVNTSTLAPSPIKKETNPKDPKKFSRRGR